VIPHLACDSDVGDPFGAAILVRVPAGFEALVEEMKNALWLYPRNRPGELSETWVTLAYPAFEFLGGPWSPC
jgi:hypothetical protein